MHSRIQRQTVENKHRIHICNWATGDGVVHCKNSCVCVCTQNSLDIFPLIIHTIPAQMWSRRKECYRDINILSHTHTVTYRKHLLQTLLRRRRNTQHAEVSDKSGCNWVSTTARGRTSCTDCHVLWADKTAALQQTWTFKYYDM